MMLTIFSALFFSCATAFAVFAMRRSYVHALSKIRALFAEDRDMGHDRVVTASIHSVAAFIAATAPDYVPCMVVTLEDKMPDVIIVNEPSVRAA